MSWPAHQNLRGQVNLGSNCEQWLEHYPNRSQASLQGNASVAAAPSRYTDPHVCKSLTYFADTLRVTKTSRYSSEPVAGGIRSLENASLTITYESRILIEGLAFTTDPSLQKVQFCYEADFGQAGFHGKSWKQIYRLATKANWIVFWACA